jgi:hypothetical protein
MRWVGVTFLLDELSWVFGPGGAAGARPIFLVRRVQTAGDAESIHLPCLARDGCSGGKRKRSSVTLDLSSRSGAIFFLLSLFALAT